MCNQENELEDVRRSREVTVDRLTSQLSEQTSLGETRHISLLLLMLTTTTTTTTTAAAAAATTTTTTTTTTNSR